MRFRYILKWLHILPLLEPHWLHCCRFRLKTFSCNISSRQLCFQNSSIWPYLYNKLTWSVSSGTNLPVLSYKSKNSTYFLHLPVSLWRCEKKWKRSILVNFLTSIVAKKFSRGQNRTYKVPRRCALIKAFQCINLCGHMAHKPA